MNSFISLRKLNCSSRVLRELNQKQRFTVEVETKQLVSKQEFIGETDVELNSFLILLDETEGWLIIFDVYLRQESIWHFLVQLERNTSVSSYILETISDN